MLTQFAPPSGSHDTATYQPYAVEGTSLWTGSGHDLVRMDTDLGKEVDRFHLDRIAGGSGVVEGVATGGGYVRVGRDVGIGQVIALDPATGRSDTGSPASSITWTSPTARGWSGRPTSVESR